MSTETVRLQATRRFGRVLAPRELWRYRDLAFQIAARDVTVRYRQTALGAAWAILQPVGFMVVFSLFFGRVAGVSSDGLPYALFSLAALVAWTYFANVLLLGSESLVANASLVAKIYFPRIFMPAGVLAAGLLDLGISLVILFAIVLIYGLVPTAAVLMLPVLILIMLAAALGVTAGLSAVNVRYRDFQHIIGHVLTVLQLVTPILYPLSLVPEDLRPWTLLNPLTTLFSGFQDVLYWNRMPAWPPLLGLLALSCVILSVATLMFSRYKRSFAEAL